MENSAYVPSTAHSPALVVFSQAAAGSLQDALRIQRPFNPQFTMAEAAKELHRPFTTSSFGLRHMEAAYGSLPAHILNHLQPQFLHPGLSLGSGAFRPLANTFSSSSAFGAPKCLKIETNSEHTDERFLEPSPRTDCSSPASLSPQHAVKEENADTQMSVEDSAEHEPQIHDDSRGFRLGHLFGGGFTGGGGAYPFSGLPPAAHAFAKTSLLFDSDVSPSKKRDPSSCPVCGMNISTGDLENHFMYELEKLYKLNGSGFAATRKRRQESGRPSSVLPGDSGPEGRWETFQRIKTNRQGRLRIKIRKRKSDENCLICIGRLHRTQEEMEIHVQQCSGKSNDEDETVDVEGDTELEDWVEGQRDRRRLNATEDIDEVIVDELEESTFGPSQYSELDVKRREDRDATQAQVATVNSSGDVEIKRENSLAQCDSNVTTSDAEPSSRVQLIDELRNRIRQLETESGCVPVADAEEYKCLICLEHYKKPVISTVCWHVHCEECWLHTLGNKKVCPQCSMITSPSDLRRIFM